MIRYDVNVTMLLLSALPPGDFCQTAIHVLVLTFRCLAMSCRDQVGEIFRSNFIESPARPALRSCQSEAHVTADRHVREEQHANGSKVSPGLSACGK